MTSLELSPTVPQCVGFIMDGNRRFAKEQGLPTIAGHQAGEATFTQVLPWVKAAGIPQAVFYAFSTENWLRSVVEVTILMDLFTLFLKKMITDVHEQQVRVHVIGRRADFSADLQALITELERASASYTELTVWVALSYGGRAEIVAAANEAVRRGEMVDEQSFQSLLWTDGMPDPDLVIRTGGDQRLSNFLPWQTVYSELFFTATYWPAFTKDEFTRIVAQYADRQRRRGK